MPELPDATRRRFVEQYGLPPYDASQLTQARASAGYFERTVAAGAAPKLASNWIMGELARKLKELRVDAGGSPLSPERLAGLIALVEKDVISQSAAKDVFEKLFSTDRSAEDIVAAESLAQIGDDQVVELVADVLARNAAAVEQYRGGKTATLGFLVGQVMKASGGKANANRVKALLEDALSLR
jgi:aspartyl-tRNA(Asn)/glutamyl-tRNA(Gln) amidotransferase subunit B